MLKKISLFKVTEWVIFSAIIFRVLQLVSRTYIIFTLNISLRKTGTSENKLPFILDELRIEDIVSYIVAIAFFISFSFWFYLQYKKASEISSLQLSYKPLWALFSLIIPIFNLFAPYRIMNDLWTVNNKNMSLEQDGRKTIKIWWFLFIATYVASRYLSYKVKQIDGLESFIIVEYYNLFFFSLSLHFFILTRKLVNMIGG